MPATNLRSRDFFSSRQERVVILHQQRQQTIGQHRHEFCEIALITGGKGTHITGNIRHQIERGHVIVITGQRTHAYQDTEELNLINILIRHQMMPRFARELQRLPGYHNLFGESAMKRPFVSTLRLSTTEFNQVEEWASRLNDETQLPRQAGRVLAEAYLTLILGVLCRCHGHRKSPSTRPTSQLGSLLEYMEKHLGKPLSMPELASRAAMSERSFFRNFREIMGTTPARHLLHIRIQHARECLTYGDPKRRINEISQECGFEDNNYFSRAFRKATGLSPMEFRNKKCLVPARHHQVPDQNLKTFSVTAHQS